MDGAGDENGDLDLDEDDEDVDDVRRMGKVWVKERGTVNLMSWEGDLMDTLFDKLEQQVGSQLPSSILLGLRRDSLLLVWCVDADMEENSERTVLDRVSFQSFYRSSRGSGSPRSDLY